MKLRYFFFILALLLGIWLAALGGEYLNCLIEHRSENWILAPREPVHETCRLRLNPFHL